MELPQRDLPQNTINISNDPEVMQNYMHQRPGYINNNINNEMLHNINGQKQTVLSNNDAIYDELKTPLLVCILYFIYSLKSATLFMKNNMPFIYDEKDEIKKGGLFLKTMLFGVIFFTIQKGISHLSII